MAILNAAVILLTLCGLIVFNKKGLGQLFEGIDRYEGSAGFIIAGVGTYTFIYFVMIAALSMSICVFSSFDLKTIFCNAPSSVRMLDLILEAMYLMISSST